MKKIPFKKMLIKVGTSVVFFEPGQNHKSLNCQFCPYCGAESWGERAGKKYAIAYSSGVSSIGQRESS